MIRRLAILAFLALAGVASAQYSDVRIHASRPTEQGPEVWLAESLPESLYTNCVLWLPFPKAHTSTQYSFAVARETNDVTISGAVWTNENAGGMFFDGIDDRLRRQMNAGLNGSNQLSIVTWVNPAGYGGGNLGRIVSCYTVNNGYMLLCLSNIAPNSICYRFQYGLAIDPTFHTPNNSLVLNSNQFVCVTYNSGSVSMYLNGLLVSSSNAAAFVGTTNQLAIGGNIADDTRTFYGKIYDVQIYSTAISSNDQKAIFDQTKSIYGVP